MLLIFIILFNFNFNLSLNILQNRLLTKRLDTNTNWEQQLLENLMKNYNKKLRPSGTAQVKFAFNLNQIINLVEKEQIVLLNAFIDHEWVDQRLKWNPEEYGNLTVVRISSDKLWT